MNNEFLEFCKNSKIEKEFNKLLDDENIKVISFDIFETLAFRKVAHHNDIFYNVGKNKYVKSIYNTPEAFKLFRIKAEELARTNNKKSNEISLKEIYSYLDLTEKQKHKIQKLELKEESENLYINKQIENWISKAHQKSKKIILISDMYLSKKNIDKLVLDKFVHNNLIFKVYISSEYKERKANKKLFELIRNDLQIEYTNWLHIGDNIESDFNIPQKFGIKTIYYNIEESFQEIISLENKYIKADTQKASNLRILTSILNPYIDKEESFYFNYGAIIFGPILWEFSHWLDKLAKKEKVEQINFIMREGQTFEKYFKKISNIQTNLIYASRKSTYLANLNEEEIDFAKLNFFKFRTFTILDIYNLYKIDLDDNVLKEYENYPIKEAQKIYFKDKSLLDIFIENFSQKIETIKDNITKERLLFLEYLKRINIHNNSILVDLGGGGTIIKNIIKTLDNNSSPLGVLFFMHDLGYKVNVINRTISFLPYNEKTGKCLELIRRTPEFIEILLNGIEKTTINYERKGSLVFPIIEHPFTNTKEFHHLEKIINAFNTGIEAFFTLLKEYKFKKIIKREVLALIIGRCIEVPTSIEVEYLEKLHLDEGKGSSKKAKLITEEQKSYLKQEGLYKAYYNLSQNIDYKKIDFHWIHGAITSIDNQFLPTVKGLINVYPNQEYINNIVELLKINKINKVNIYGAGVLFVKLKPYLVKNNIEIISVMDSRANLSQFEFSGHIIKTLESQINENNLYPIIVASVEYSFEISDLIIRYLKTKNLKTKIINDYDGMVEL